MLKADHGHIVTIASMAGTAGVPGLADYCASKHAAVGFDESIRLEAQKLGKYGVKTTVVRRRQCETVQSFTSGSSRVLFSRSFRF